MPPLAEGAKADVTHPVFIVSQPSRLRADFVAPGRYPEWAGAAGTFSVILDAWNEEPVISS